MKFEINSELYTLRGYEKSIKKYKFGKKWTYNFAMEPHDTHDMSNDFQILLTTDSIKTLCGSILQLLLILKKEFRKQARLFVNVELTFENLR